MHQFVAPTRGLNLGPTVGIGAVLNRPRIIDRSHDLVQLLQSHQNVSRFRAIRRPKYARQLELIDDTSGTPIPDTHSALQQRCRAELVLNAHLRRLAEQGITLAGSLLSAPGSVLPF